jgi:hypothetical protein
MKGLLYIIPADPKAIRERCEITAPPTVEEPRKIVGGYSGIVHGFTSIDIYGDGLAMPCVANEDGKRLGSAITPNSRRVTSPATAFMCRKALY